MDELARAPLRRAKPVLVALICAALSKVDASPPILIYRNLRMLYVILTLESACSSGSVVSALSAVDIFMLE